MKQTLTAALVASVITLVLASWLFDRRTVDPNSIAASTKESAYERVMRTGVLRCGYGMWNPFVMKDPATNEMTGLFVELTEAMGTMSGIEIEWTAEVDWGTVPNSLRTGKIDAHCAGMWPDSRRARQLAFMPPLTHMEVGLIVKHDDPRFQANETINLAAVNRPEFTTVLVEGDVTDTLSRGVFTQTQRYTLPMLGNAGDVVASIISGKADFSVGPKVFAMAINAEEERVKFIPIEPAFQSYGNVMAVDIYEHELKEFLTANTREILSSAVYDQIMRKYEAQYPGAILRPAKPYEVTQ